MKLGVGVNKHDTVDDINPALHIIIFRGLGFRVLGFRVNKEYTIIPMV